LIELHPPTSSVSTAAPMANFRPANTVFVSPAAILPAIAFFCSNYACLRQGSVIAPLPAPGSFL
jgi:hypothetical protein